MPDDPAGCDALNQSREAERRNFASEMATIRLEHHRRKRDAQAFYVKQNRSWCGEDFKAGQKRAVKAGQELGPVSG